MGRDLGPSEWIGGRARGGAGGRSSGWAGRAGGGEGGREGGGDPGVVLFFFTRLGSAVEILHNKTRGIVGHKNFVGHPGTFEKIRGTRGQSRSFKPILISCMVRIEKVHCW